MRLSVSRRALRIHATRWCRLGIVSQIVLILKSVTFALFHSDRGRCFCSSPMTFNVEGICCGSNCRRRRHFLVMYTNFSNSRRPIDRFASDYYFFRFFNLNAVFDIERHESHKTQAPFFSFICTLYTICCIDSFSGSVLRTHEFNKQTRYDVGLNRMQLHESTNEFESEFISWLRFGHLSDDLFNDSISNRLKRPSHG